MAHAKVVPAQPACQVRGATLPSPQEVMRDADHSRRKRDKFSEGSGTTGDCVALELRADLAGRGQRAGNPAILAPRCFCARGRADSIAWLGGLAYRDGLPVVVGRSCKR